MKLSLFTKTALAVCLIFCAANAQAQWSTSVNTDNNLHYTAYSAAVFCSDGHGGAIYAWLDQTNNISGIRANRIDSLGFIRWGNTGVAINGNIGGFSTIAICEDGKRGAYISYSRANITNTPLFCQHIDSAGTSLWDSTGVQPFAFVRSYQSGQYNPTMVNDNGQGVFIVTTGGVTGGTSEVLAQRLNINGAKQWGAGGVFVDTVWAERSPQAIADGHNGITIIWIELTFGGSNLKMQRLDHNGAAKFTGGVKYLHGTAPYDSYVNYKIIRTAKNNYVAVWVGTYSGGGSTQPRLFSQKLNAAGTSLWAGNAVAVCDTSGVKANPDILSDGNDGVYYLWADGRKGNAIYGAYAQHVNAPGHLVWQKQGLQLDSNIMNNPVSISLAPNTDKGLKAFYLDEATGANKAYMQILDSNGVKKLSGLGNPIAAYGHNVSGNLPVSNNHDILFLTPGFAKYVPFGNILPISLIGFTAENNGKINLLNWKTAFGANMQYFTVERGNNGYSFAPIGRVPAAANSDAGTNTYRYGDAAIYSHDIFYRLKCVDADGEYSYSNIVSIHKGIISSMRIAPNPATNNCIIYFEKATDGQSVMNIFSLDGKLLKRQSLAAGQYQVSLDVSNLAAGSYFISLQANGKTSVQKLAVVR